MRGDDGKFRKLDSYSGELTPEQAAKGIAAAIENAAALLADAELLLEHKRFPRAAALALLAIEEAGKVSILRQLVAASGEELRRAWKAFRTHTAKNAHAHLPDAARATGKRRAEDFRLDDFVSVFTPDAEHPRLYDAVKQLGFYTDCLGPAHWATPSDVIDERTARALIATARGVATSKEPRGINSAAGLALWAIHMSRPGAAGSRRALLGFYEAAQQQGLLRDGELAKMRRFLGADEGNDA